MGASHRVLVVGALGRMGERVRSAVAAEPALSLCAALEAPGHPSLGDHVENDVRVGDDAKAALAQADVAILIQFGHVRQLGGIAGPILRRVLAKAPSDAGASVAPEGKDAADVAGDA